jgi:lysozyme
MITFDPRLLQLDLIRDEGLRLKPYPDSVGKLTIGVGRNLDDRGISRDEALILCANDVAVAAGDLDRNASWWRGLSEPRARALMNMAFNLGWPRLAGFKVMLAALEHGDNVSAAREALDSAWAKQVGMRAVRIADLFKEG